MDAFDAVGLIPVMLVRWEMMGRVDDTIRRVVRAVERTCDRVRRIDRRDCAESLGNQIDDSSQPSVGARQCIDHRRLDRAHSLPPSTILSRFHPRRSPLRPAFRPSQPRRLNHEHHRLRRHRLGPTSSALCPHDDRAGPRALLRRHGPEEERAHDHHAQLHLHGARHGPVGRLRVQPRVRPRQVAASSAGWNGWASRGVGLEPSATRRPIPHQAFMMFQLMFAIITPALITGAFAERMKFSAYFVFALGLDDPRVRPVAHWVWADGGWLREIGAIDFAGGTVVHLTSGVSALVAVLSSAAGRATVKRWSRTAFSHPHRRRAPLVRLVRLQRRQRLERGALATSAFVATNIAAAAATITWMLTEWRVRGTPSVMGAAAGAIAGLVAITPASGYVTPLSALVIGAIRRRGLLRRLSHQGAAQRTTTRSMSSACTAWADCAARCSPASSPRRGQSRRRRWTARRQRVPGWEAGARGPRAAGMGWRADRHHPQGDRRDNRPPGPR